MLGKVDKNVRDYIISLRHRGGPISRTAAIATVKVFIQSSNTESLRSMVLGEPRVSLEEGTSDGELLQQLTFQ